MKFYIKKKERKTPDSFNKFSAGIGDNQDLAHIKTQTSLSESQSNLSTGTDFWMKMKISSPTLYNNKNLS